MKLKNSFSKVKYYLLLHLGILILSFSTIFSKLASKQSFMSFKFILLYVGVIFSLFIYAIIWQQILKRIDLTTAFANKSAMLFWSLVWGVTIFHEQVKVQIIIGLLFVGLGVYFVVKSNE